MGRDARSRLIELAPLLAHLVIYGITCLVAAVLFYVGYRPFVVLVEYFSGTPIPGAFSSAQEADLLALFIGAPILFTVGYLGGMRIGVRILHAAYRAAGGPADTRFGWLPLLVFCIVASVGIYDLARVGAFSRVGAWLDYGMWIQARWALFSTLGFFHFVNLYLLVPVAAAWTLLSVQGTGLKTRVLRWAPTLIALALTFFLFQKKALITALIIILGALFFYHMFDRDPGRKLRWLLVSAIGITSVVYFFLVVLPIYSEASRTIKDVLTDDSRQQSDEITRRTEEVLTLLGDDRSTHVLAYALLAPMTRTSAPAMYYPIVFPAQHEYFGLDLGQDILGIGSMPDDNRVVWKYMYPDIAGGSVAAPFQFVLYSQVGTPRALVLSALLGVMFGILWRSILTSDANRALRSLLGSLLLLFSIYLAIDSLRGSVVASYGVIWGLIFVLLVFFIGRRLRVRAPDRAQLRA